MSRSPSGPRAAAGAAAGRPPDALKDILRQVRRIELRTERLVGDLAAGRYRSAFKGSGLEFDEVREYTPGDDVRTIDWNVTARAGRPFVKVFREERELTTMLLVDISGSMRFGALPLPGGATRSKLALAAEAAAVVAVNAMRNHDRIGLVTFSDGTALHLPARKGRAHAMRLLREVLAADGRAARADFSAALDEVRRVVRRRAVVFLVSDFLGVDAGFADALARAARRHDVVGLRVADQGEARLPDCAAPLVLADAEGGDEVVLAAGRGARARYAAAYAAEQARVGRLFRGAGCDLVDLDTALPAIDALQRFFRERRRRIHG